MRNRSRNAIIRSVPFLLSVYSIAIVWFTKCFKKPENAIRNTPWYKKEVITFSDMFAAARQDILQEIIKQSSGQNTGEFLFPSPYKMPQNRKKRQLCGLHDS
ncbi:MAG TPA: hypothetical protein DC049_08095 [Spirochaetia bacterium]|nr:hypothetical protein [Spirochaetia bacterium]